MKAEFRKGLMFLLCCCALLLGCLAEAAAQSISCQIYIEAPAGSGTNSFVGGYSVDSSSSNVINIGDVFQASRQYSLSLQNCSQPLSTVNWSVNGQSSAGAGSQFSTSFTSPAAGSAVIISMQAGAAATTFGATLNGGTASAPTPFCNISGPTSAAPGEVVTLNATSCTNSPTGFEWNSPLSGQGTAQATVQIPSNAASGSTYFFTLRASNASGFGAVSSIGIQVAGTGPAASIPACTIAGAPTAPVAPGTSVSLSANCSNSPTGYQWYAGSSIQPISTAPRITVNPSSTTTYKLVATNSAGSSSAVSASIQIGSQTASIKPTSTAALTALPGVPLTLEVVVTDNGVPPAPIVGASVSWTVQSGTGDTLSSPSSSTDANGKARVNLTIAAATGSHVVRASVSGSASYDFNVNNGAVVIQQAATQVSQAVLQTAIIAPQAQLANIRNRLDQIRAQRRGNVSSANVKVSAQGLPLPIDQFASAFKKKELSQGRGASADEFERWGVFINGDVEFGRQTPLGGQGFELASRGVTVGLDYQLEGGHVIGAGLGFAKSSTDLFGNAGKQDSKGQSLSVYASYVPSEKTYVDLALNLGRNNYNTDRRLLGQDGLITGEIANSDTSGDQKAFALTFGGDLNMDSLRFNPYARYEYIRATVDGFTESGSRQNMQFSGQEVRTSSITAGMQASYAISTGFGVVTPQGRLEFTRQSTNNPNAVTASLISGGNPIVLPRVDQTGNFGMAGVGVTVLLARGISTYLNYEAMFANTDTSLRRWTLGMRIPF